MPLFKGFRLKLDKKYRILVPALLVLLCLVLHYVVELLISKSIRVDLPSWWSHYLPLLSRLLRTLAFLGIIVLVERLIENMIISRSEIAGTRYNLIRIMRLLTFVLVAIVAASFVFQNLYAAAVSFGLISLVLGFALQAPIASFIGWLYIVFRAPYQVGDRVQLGNLRGDVIDIGYFDTIIKECSGDYLGNDRLSGRVINLPNSRILRSEVINYSGEFRPFIWNETALQVAFTSDMQFVEEALLSAARDDFSDSYPGFDEGGRNAPAVYFRVNERAWMEAVVSYPVRPSDTTGRRNRILKRALPALNQAPDKVQFPAGSRR